MNEQGFCVEWVEEARNKSQSAMAELYKYAYKDVYLAVKCLIKTDEETVLDITQESFLKAFADLNLLGSDDKFKPWIKTIARNKALDWLRKKKPMVFSSFQTGDEYPEPAEMQIRDRDMSHDPEMVVDRQETSRLVWEIMDTLSEGQRLAVSMYYFNDMSIKDIARLNGCKEGTIKAHLYNGRKKIETKVRELEKNGTKLYGLAPVAFLFSNMKALDIQPSAEILNAVLGKSGAISGTALASSNTAHIASGVGAAARSAAGKTAAHALALKVAIGVVSVGLLGGGAFAGAGYLAYINGSQPSTEQSAGATEDAAQTQSAATAMEACRKTLLDLEKDGAFLQFAHLEDLNGDGEDEMFVLYDDKQFRLYEYDGKGEMELAVECVADNGFMWQHNGPLEGVRWSDRAKAVTEDVALEDIYLTVFVDDEEQPAIYLFQATPGDDYYTKQTKIVYKDGEYQEILFYAEQDNEGVVHPFINNEAVSADEFDKAGGSYWGSAPRDDLKKILGEAEEEETLTYKGPAEAAYASFLQSESWETQYEPRFQMVYIDEDDIPELAVMLDPSHAGDVRLYCYDEGVHDMGHYGHYGMLPYIERGNLIECTDSHMDFHHNYLYQMRNNGLEEITAFDGEYKSDPDGDDSSETLVSSTFHVNGQIVDESTYAAEVESLTGVKPSYGYSDAVSYAQPEKWKKVSYDEAYDITPENISKIFGGE